MATTGTLIGYLLVAFASSAFLGYWITERRRASAGQLPELGTTLRLRTASGVYRSKLLQADARGWRISAPLSRNHFVPLRVDEAISVEAPVEGGVYLFKTVVAARDGEGHEMVLRAPVNPVPRERREVKRCLRDEPAKVDGFPGRLVDISALGARLKSEQRFGPGERVRLDLSDGLIFAWVLDSWPTRHGDPWQENVRVRFETTMEAACG